MYARKNIYTYLRLCVDLNFNFVFSSLIKRVKHYAQSFNQIPASSNSVLKRMLKQPLFLLTQTIFTFASSHSSLFSSLSLYTHIFRD